MFHNVGLCSNYWLVEINIVKRFCNLIFNVGYCGLILTFFSNENTKYDFILTITYNVTYLLV